MIGFAIGMRTVGGFMELEHLLSGIMTGALDAAWLHQSLKAVKSYNA